jgi:hypothetical protein
MIYEVKQLTNEELQHLYIQESNKFMAAVNMNISHNLLQSLKLNLFHLDTELENRKNFRWLSRR